MRVPDLTAVIEDRQNQGRIQFKESVTGAGRVKLAVHVTEDSLGPGRNSIDLVRPREGIIDCNPKVFIRRDFLQLRAVQKQGLVVPLLPPPANDHVLSFENISLKMITLRPVAHQLDVALEFD